MEQLRIIEAAPSAVTMTCHYHWRTGWSLSVSVPVAGEARWATRQYDCLSTSELHDVACAELGRALVLPDDS